MFISFLVLFIPIGLRKCAQEQLNDFTAAHAEIELNLPSERLQWVRLWALRSRTSLQQAVRALLLNEQALLVAMIQLTVELAGATDETDRKTLNYLIARQLQRKEAWPEAIAYLERADGHPFLPIEAERLRLLAEAHAANGLIEEGQVIKSQEGQFFAIYGKSFLLSGSVFIIPNEVEIL